MHSIPASLSPSSNLARQRVTLLAISTDGSDARRIRILEIPSGSIRSFRSSNNLHHSISNNRLSSPPSSSLSSTQIAALEPASCATREVVRGTTPCGFHSMLAEVISGCVCHVPGRSPKAIDSTKW
ncbi:MAG: Uncharacterised protein [Methanobacteriota archaeon]|nr:MAG: Uncharacterised protein [Euryarchaeota archaeon]